MADGVRIALLDSLASSPWREACHRLAPLVPAIEALGHQAILVDAAVDGGVPVLAGAASEGDVLPLIEARRVLGRVAAARADLCLVPARGGLAHGVLMARACGELDTGLRVALVADDPSRALALRGDLLRHRLKPLVADAMERFCLGEADVLLGPSTMIAAMTTLGVPLPATVSAESLALEASVLLRTPGPVTDILFVGPFARAAGVVSFIDAAERLATTGWGGGIAFAGPIEEAGAAPGKAWLGRRATGWAFPFRVHETASFADAFGLASRPGTLAWLPHVPRALLATHLAGAGSIEVTPLEGNAATNGVALEAALRAALARAATGPAVKTAPSQKEGRLANTPPAPPAIAFPSGTELDALLRACQGVPRRRAPAPVGLSVCILHRDRPALLAMAVRSVTAEIGAADVEVIVLDNASTAAGTAALLDGLAATPGLTVIRLATPIAAPAAMNRLATAARHPFLVFLDDDNVLAAGGLARLGRACAQDRFDVIASTLDMFEGSEAAPGASVATTVFIGPARTAGLFFNAFGDTSMAVRRSAFLALGGFDERPGPYPAADWIFLAKAQAAGLALGVLQEPAFRYRRDLHKQDVHWQKYDRHGVRQHLLDVYGDAFDPLLLAKVAQSVMLDQA